MNWDQQALEVWVEESACQEEDNMTIAKYARADESKIKAKGSKMIVLIVFINFSLQELSLKMERLNDMIEKKKKLLDNEVIETVSAQIELDKTAENFRRAHEEREQLINQWEQTIMQMKRRDQDMDRGANVMALVYL